MRFVSCKAGHPHPRSPSGEDSEDSRRRLSGTRECPHQTPDLSVLSGAQRAGFCCSPSQWTHHPSWPPHCTEKGNSSERSDGFLTTQTIGHKGLPTMPTTRISLSLPNDTHSFTYVIQASRTQDYTSGAVTFPYSSLRFKSEDSPI